ncbi:hypothetical protein [Hymenobacter negativus]|uniref:hypothetical protein n=1 Tax=Hymenobacter negativus TaxID=2795026 RepID=UPI001AAEB11F|nr:hypothetical protein [Hymenobacter negativus]
MFFSVTDCAERLVRLALLLPLAGTAFSCQGPSSQQLSVVRLHQLEGALLGGNDNLSKVNASQFQQMEIQAHATGMRPADQAVLSQARALHDSARALSWYLRSLRERLNQRTHGPDLLEQLATRGAVGEFMRVPADSLRQRLSNYEHLLQQTDATTSEHPTRAPGQYALAPFDFEHTTLAGALVALSRYETELLLQEETALARMSAKLTPSRLRSALHTMVSAQTSSISPGATYRAQVQVAQARFQPGALTMMVNGRPIPVGPDGIGHVELPTSALRQGTRLQTYWDGSITVRISSRDSTFRLRVPYTVVK